MSVVHVFKIQKWESQGPLVLVEKLMEFGILPKHGTMFCPQNHPTPMTLRASDAGFQWRCNHLTIIKKKNLRQRCNFGVSLNSGTFFAKAKISYEDICKFICFWLDNIPLTVISKNLEFGSEHTSVHWASFCREVTYEDLVTNKRPIGGVGRTVELDESKFGKRKYNRGKRVEGQWVFGGYERETGYSFMVPVVKRDVSTLIPIIEEWVLPGTTVITDFWKTYDCMDKEKYHHLKVNHSLNFKDPETGACTNSIEGSWAHAKRSIPGGGRRKDFMPGYLAKYMFVRRCKAQKLDPFVEFCRIAGVLYDATKQFCKEELDMVVVEDEEEEEEEMQEEVEEEEEISSSN